MVTGAVVVSSQTTSTRAANLLASFIIIPMALVINGESIIMFLAPDAESPNGIGALWAIIAGMMVVVILLLRVGNSIFNREELLGRTIDTVNLRKAFSSIWKWCRAVDDDGSTASNIVQWYRRAVPYSLKKLKSPAWVVLIVFVGMFLFGFLVGLHPDWRLPLPPESEVMDMIEANSNVAFLENMMAPEVRATAISFVVANNGRILLGALLLSMFTFGVGGLVFVPAVYVVVGYGLSQLLLAGWTLTPWIAGIVPHGIVEIPMSFLAAAIMLRLGAVVTRPPQNQTVGEAWTIALGDTLKLAVGLVIPMLLIGAVIEATITPRVIVWVLGIGSI